jgi:nitrogen-specific signal transduction histidine kinase
MFSANLPAQSDVESLKGLIGWFNHNSLELIEEYRRLEERVDHLKGELKAKNEELEKSLRSREEARAYLNSILEGLKGGVLVLDHNLHSTFANRQLLELTGDITDQRVVQLLGEKLAASLQRGDKEFLPLECEKIVQGPGGVMTPIHFTLSEVRTGGGASHYVLVCNDITSLKRLEAEAARTRRLASLGVMASEVAHQVKSPLGGIELYASLLKEKSKGDTKRLASEILDAVRRLSTTLSHLFAFSAEPAISADVLPISALMKDVVEECMPLFDDPLWSIVVDIEPDLPPLWGDRSLLTQALLNLIVNAKESMPEGGRVSLAVRLSPFSAVGEHIHRAVELRVRDDGIGIDVENRERIFDPFFTTKKQGTGLGLALAHKIISAHRGLIDVAAEAGQGSQFIVSLPAAEEI